MRIICLVLVQICLTGAFATTGLGQAPFTYEMATARRDLWPAKITTTGKVDLELPGGGAGESSFWRGRRSN